MGVPSFRVFQPFFFSVLTVALLASKLLHLFLHAHSIPLLHFVVYFATFFLQDCFLIVAQRVLLHGQSRNITSILGLCIGGFLATISLGAAASQFGFYYVTGGELQWDAAGSVASDPAAMRLMMSGIVPVCVAGLALVFASLAITPVFYNKTGCWLASISKFASPANWDMMLPLARVKKEFSTQRVVRLWPLCGLTTLCALAFLVFLRPAIPYNHISATLPVALGSAMHSRTKHCAGSYSLANKSFPRPNLIEPDRWILPKDNFKGWAPGKVNAFIRQYSARTRSWIPDALPDGFERWDKQAVMAIEKHENDTMLAQDGKNMCLHQSRTHYYNPVADPLRISNLNLEPYEALRHALKDILISHVVLVTMESTRKDMFPIKKASHLYKEILRSYKPNQLNQDKIDSNLSQLTRVAEQVTGESFSSSPDKHPDLLPGVWKDQSAPGMGGINVVGALTGSSLSFKSVVGSHCGVGPLPVDFLEEVNGKIYQPCIPQIMELFNREKKTFQKQGVNEALLDHRASVHRREWESVFVQSITDQYDRQDVLNRHMSFGKSFTKETLENIASKYYPPKTPELNYFGYAESEVKPFIRDVISETIANNKRLFLSHFTSTTHHPWAIPQNFTETQYMGSEGSHEHMNAFLNVAFEEDAEKTGTYENAHISNFRVPLVFRHPQLPRIQVAANATSMSILPTILDLLISTNSLDAIDTTAASDLIHDYEAQSLLRPYRPSLSGRQAWNFGIINSGGSMLAITSAAVPYRLVIPLGGSHTFRFTHMVKDPNELHPLEKWTLGDIVNVVKHMYGEEAASWVREADAVARWWAAEMRRLYNYNN
ncbi:sulfatase domain-containing protein [Histoplasma capsulatum H143]|uniref:Sulfatase domain-containing protein n=1 Tax=Ajellomyces capsulatus (strain H143) TaxID=544712 RepID=C6H8I8_AJECH|nr:sulfatase domain-containing protein [Histoplasma capsulatum H143]